MCFHCAPHPSLQVKSGSRSQQVQSIANIYLQLGQLEGEVLLESTVSLQGSTVTSGLSNSIHDYCRGCQLAGMLQVGKPTAAQAVSEHVLINFRQREIAHLRHLQLCSHHALV